MCWSKVNQGCIEGAIKAHEVAFHLHSRWNVFSFLYSNYIFSIPWRIVAATDLHFHFRIFSNSWSLPSPCLKRLVLIRIYSAQTAVAARVLLSLKYCFSMYTPIGKSFSHGVNSRWKNIFLLFCPSFITYCLMYSLRN